MKNVINFFENFFYFSYKSGIKIFLKLSINKCPKDTLHPYFIYLLTLVHPNV